MLILILTFEILLKYINNGIGLYLSLAETID